MWCCPRQVLLVLLYVHHYLAKQASQAMHCLCTGSLAPLPSPLLAKSTTVYVGKIAATVDDATIKALLEACGAVRSWKRVTDPETQAPKGFGFCEYEDAEGVLRAIRLLHNLSLDGQELLLKCNSTTQKYVDDYKARKAPSTAPEEERDNAAMEAVMAIVSDRASAAKPPDAIDSFLSSVKEERSHEKEERPRERDRDRGRRGERESLESSLHRERERERAAEQARAAEYERRYNKLLIEWEAHERCAALSAFWHGQKVVLHLLGAERPCGPRVGL